MSFRKFLFSSAYVAILGAFVGCGGESDSLDEDTVSAPSTLDDLVLTIPGANVSIEFVRSSSSPRDVSTGQTEFGNGIMTSNGGHVEYDSSLGVATDVYWPNTMEQMSYTYERINNTSGLLQITTANGDYANTNDLRVQEFFTDDQPWLGFFHNAIDTGTYSDLFEDLFDIDGAQPHPSSHVTNMILTFDTEGITVTQVGVRLAPSVFNDTLAHVTRFSIYHPDSTFRFTAVNGIAVWDQFNPADLADVTFFLSGGELMTNTGASVPIDYTQDELTGDIAADSLDIETIVFSPNDGSPSYEIEFNALETAIGEETGVGVYIDSTPEAVPENITYEYITTEGIDQATLTIGAEQTPTQTTPGVYTIDFLTIGETSLGNVIQTGVYSIAGQPAVTGTFRMSVNAF